MSSATARVPFYTCWLPEVAAPVYPGPITEPPPITLPPEIPPLPNPVLAYPDMGDLPEPDITPADYCSRLIYLWLAPHAGASTKLTPAARALLVQVTTDAFDVLDWTGVEAEVARRIADWQASVQTRMDEWQQQVTSRQADIDQLTADRDAEIVQLEADRQAEIAQIDADYQADVLQREQDIADCEAARHPGPPDPGIRITVATRSTARRSSATAASHPRRATLKIRMSAHA